MENSSLSSEVWNNVTTSSSVDGYRVFSATDLVAEAFYYITGAVGVLSNLFVIVIFILFIKITNKVNAIHVPPLTLEIRISVLYHLHVETRGVDRIQCEGARS